MKRFYIVILGVLMAGYAVMAQSPFRLTYENHAHRGDQDFKFIIAQNVNGTIAQGANQVWDFSTVTNSPKNLTSFMLPSAKGLKSSSIPEANIIISENNNEFYFKLTRNKMEQYGTVSCNSIIKYDQPFVKLKFPFAYGESYSGNFSARQIASNGHETALTGRYNVGITGYGTLIMPTGQIVENTLLLRTEIVHVYGTSEYSTITYRWYVENVRYPIFVIIKSGVKGTEKTIQTAYHENVPIPEKAINADILSNNSEAFMAYPNPYNDLLNISYRIDKECKVKIEVYDVSGKRISTLVNNILQSEGIYNVEFKDEDVSIPAGIYYVKARLGNDNFEQKVIKTLD